MVPDLQTVERIAEVLGCAPSELTDHTDTAVTTSQVVDLYESSPWPATIGYDEIDRAQLLREPPETWYDTLPDPADVHALILHYRRIRERASRLSEA